MVTNSRINSSRTCASKRGFGLAELVTAVAVLAIIAAVAIPAMAGYGETANVRRCQRIAQDYAMLANSAAAAGCFTLAEAGSLAEVMEMLSNGVTGSGVFDETEFKLPSVSMIDRDEAAHHLTWDDGVLYFDPVEPH